MEAVLEKPRAPTRMMSASLNKRAAHEMVDEFSSNTTLDKLAYTLYVRRKIERGLADIKAGRVVPHSEILKEFGITR